MVRDLLQRSEDEFDRDDFERLAGQMIVAGFEGAGDSPPSFVSEWLASDRVAGVILFARNVESTEQVGALNQNLLEAASESAPAPVVSVDQEGGRVMRIRDGFPDVPPMWEVFEQGGVDAVREVSKAIAEELSQMAFNLNFAPVLDVRTNPDNEVIGDRAFSDEPEAVGRAATAFIEAHHASGMMTCGKHFPGHGDTLLDSHEDLPVVDHDIERLRRVEFPPFRAAIDAGVPAVMTAHILMQHLDDEHPATLSRATIDCLRDELDFEGVVVSDDIEMKALADRYSPTRIADLGLDAGIDLFLVCHTPSKVRELRTRLAERAATDATARERIIRSARRVADLRATLG